jgi:hypothetical protein
MVDEQSDYEQLEHALWFHLMCMCSCCDRCDEYPASMEATDEPSEWAKIVAPLAQADGWTAPGVLFLLCPDCRARGVDWRKLYSPPPSGFRLVDREAFQRQLDHGPDSRPRLIRGLRACRLVAFFSAWLSILFVGAVPVSLGVNLITLNDRGILQAIPTFIWCGLSLAALALIGSLICYRRLLRLKD